MDFHVNLVDLRVLDESTEEQENWFQARIVEGRQKTALKWLDSTGLWKERTDRRSRTVAARMLAILGDSRGSELLHIRNFRVYPDDPVAMFYGAFSLMRRFGELTALESINEFLGRSGSRPDEESAFGNLWAFKGVLEARFRDFSRAYQSIAKARELDPGDTWNAIQRSRTLLLEDRPEEALEESLQSLEKTPNYWAVISDVADSYWAHNRDAEAFALLERGLRDNEGPGAAQQLIHCYDEVEEYEKGLGMLEEYERRVSEADSNTKKWIEAYRASFLYQLGRGEEMVRHAEASEREFYKKIATRVSSGKFAKGKRLRLQVPFIRQNALTCAPATLTALSQFFGKSADHLEVAEEICYDGTSDYKERLWAEQQGWHVRVFRADWDVTRKLIDNGFPFALATVEPTSAHLQAVVGYDSRAGTIIIRDPGHRHYAESIAKHFFKKYADSGPRGMVMVPMERKTDLEQIKLPESDEYDLIHEINVQLDKHDRTAAVAALERLRTIDPGGRISDQGALSLSIYDSDNASGLLVAERMLERFPKSIRCEYALYCRRYTRMSREERLEFLRERTIKKSAFTLYFKEYAEMLAEDARLMEEARYQFRRAIRFRRLDAEVYYGYAGALWSEREFDRAAEIYRIAFCLAERNERYADAYFTACRWIRQTEDGISILRRRFERFGSSSGNPAITLADALRSVDRDAEVAELLEEALKRAPEDGILISYAAKFFAATRRHERAEALVEHAKGRISEVTRLRILASVANLDSKPSEALEYWGQILVSEPLAMDAHRAIASLLHRITGSDWESVEHLRQACEKHAYYVPLHECLVGWLRDRGPGAAEVSLRNLVEKHPSNAWGWRELALDLGQQLRFDEAQEAVGKSIELCPRLSWSFSIRGVLFEDAREFAEARRNYREALLLDVENTSALEGIVRVCNGIVEKLEAFAFIEEQMKEQVLFGEALHTYRSIAFSVLEPEELLESLKRANEARPDLWETWSVLTDQYLAMGLMDEAEECATEQSKRFPVMPRSWLNLAEVLKHRGERDREIEALKACLTLNPQWANPMRRMADAFEARGDHDEAVEMLERALKESPLEAASHGCLADLLWKMGKPNDAFEVLLRGVRLDPSYGWGWENLGEWAKRLDRKDEAILEGIQLTERLPLNWESWQRLSDLHGTLGTKSERFEVLERGLKHLPLSPELRDNYAWLLCQSGRYQAALEECSEVRWPGGSRPRSLAGREAWIERQRDRKDVAIEKMERTVSSHPDYYWAHECLVDWYIERDEFGKAEKSARQLIRLAPTAPQPHGILADLLARQNKHAESREELERAFALSNDYFYAGYQLVRIDLEAKDFPSADKTLKILEFNHPGAASCYELRCRLEAGRRNKEEALAALYELCRTPEVAAASLELAESALQAVGDYEPVVAVYRKALDSGEARNQSVMERWIKRTVTGKRIGKSVEALLSMRLEEGLYEAGWQGLIYELERLGKRRAALSLARKHRDVFRGNSRLWASVAYLLRQEGLRNEMREWTADWKERDGLRPWMFINMAFNELMLNGIGGAGPLHVFAAVELPEEHDTWQHYACASYYEASCGRIAEAKDLLCRAESGPLSQYYSGILGLSRCHIAAIEKGEFFGRLFCDAIGVYGNWANDKEFRIYVGDLLWKYWRQLLRDRDSRLLTIRAIWGCLIHRSIL